jgi:hypothetical protein
MIRGNVSPVLSATGNSSRFIFGIYENRNEGRTTENISFQVNCLTVVTRDLLHTIL